MAQVVVSLADLTCSHCLFTHSDMAFLDLRSAPFAERHRPMFAAFDALPLDDHLELHDDRDLQALKALLEAVRGATFDWKALEAPQGHWRVRLSKLVQHGACEGCACQCGGARLAFC